YYARSRAFIFPGEEDFGITPLEAQASGTPVVAYGAGGALESVVDGETGVFFDKQDPDSLAQAVLQHDRMDFSPAVIRRHAEKFDVEIFKNKIKNFVVDKVTDFSRKGMS
ncbi:MAG: glycosyltransferase, partial [bacterium]